MGGSALSLLEQVRVGARSHEYDFLVGGVVPNEQEIGFDMAFPMPLVVPAQHVRLVTRFERFPVDKLRHYFVEMRDVPASFFGPLSILLELSSVVRRVHGLFVGVELLKQ